MDLANSLHWQIRRTLNLLAPYDVARRNKLRVGAAGDGGYVMLDGFESIEGAYSLGVGGDVSWDLEMAERGIAVHQFDHTVPGPPVQHKLFTFTKKGIAAEDGGEFVALSSVVTANQHARHRNLILKMDIEGAEWEVIAATPPSILACFEQIVLEVHEFLRISDPQWRAMTQHALGKLNQTHVCYHIHGNNWGRYEVIEGVPVPDVLEASFVRRDNNAYVPSRQFYPTPFDVPCHPDRPDFVLGNFRFL